MEITSYDELHLDKIGDKLIAEQKHILGYYLRIFGYAKMQVTDIGDMLMVTRNAAHKKINKALEDLYELIWDSEVKYSSIG